MTLPPESWLQKNFRTAVLLALAALFLLYQLLFLHYRPYDVDNPWFLSFSYAHHVQHLRTDEFLHMRFPYGMDGTQYFGRIAADGQAAVASLFGWQQRPMAILSSGTIVASLGLWAWALRRMGYAPRLILTFLIVAGTAEPFVSAANRFRFEPLSFLLTSAGLLLSTFDFVFPAILVAALAVETQPSALLGLLPVLAFNLQRHGLSWKLAARTALALVLAAAFTLLLHPALWQLLHAGQSTTGSVPLQVLAADHSGFIAYFLMPRHLPETLFLAITPWIFLLLGRRLPAKTAWIAWSALAAAALAVLSPHPNVIYTLFFYPLLLLLALLWFSERHLPWIVAACVVSATAQYGYLAHLNRGQGYRATDIAIISDMITQGEQSSGMHDADVRILGDYSLWYAHPHNFVAAGENNAAYAATSDLLLCYRQRPPGASQPRFMMDCDEMLRLRPASRLLGSSIVRGNTVWLYTSHLPHG